MSSTAKPQILFLGATGGCTLAALIHSLNAGYPCTALVRTPSKLTSLLASAAVPEQTLSTLLTIHSGDALSIPAVKKALLVGEEGTMRLPDTIISGLGATPRLEVSRSNALFLFNLDDLTICQNAATALLAALKELRVEYPQLQSSRPLLSFISSTGISRGPEDVPWAMRFLYHQLLHVPHLDKKAMEDSFRGEGGKVFRAVVGVRPTLLTNGVERGANGIRVGTEERPAELRLRNR